jgi:hypothetical protein
MFGDAPRFSSKQTPLQSDPQLQCSANNATENVGPGVYYNTAQDNKRNGWGTKSWSSKREPMNPSSSSPSKHERSDFYMHSTLSQKGELLAAPYYSSDAPGPGYYDPTMSSSIAASSKSSKSRSSSRSRMTTRDDRDPTKSLVRNDVLFQSTEPMGHYIGPGEAGSMTALHTAHICRTAHLALCCPRSYFLATHFLSSALPLLALPLSFYHSLIPILPLLYPSRFSLALPLSFYLGKAM